MLLRCFATVPRPVLKCIRFAGGGIRQRMCVCDLDRLGMLANSLSFRNRPWGDRQHAFTFITQQHIFASASLLPRHRRGCPARRPGVVRRLPPRPLFFPHDHIAAHGGGRAHGAAPAAP